MRVNSSLPPPPNPSTSTRDSIFKKTYIIITQLKNGGFFKNLKLNLLVIEWMWWRTQAPVRNLNVLINSSRVSLFYRRVLDTFKHETWNLSLLSSKEHIRPWALSDYIARSGLQLHRSHSRPYLQLKKSRHWPPPTT